MAAEILASAHIVPNLSVRNGEAAIEFYKEAFGALELFRIGAPGQHIFAELSIQGARFFLADEAPASGNLSPAALGGTSVRIDLLVSDPDALHDRALRAGATQISPVRDEADGPRMGVVEDPFGHRWLIGRHWTGKTA